MSYQAMIEMAASTSLVQRIAAAAASQGVEAPEGWVRANIWKFAAEGGWDDVWQAARDSYNVNQNPDTGMRTDVISDEMIAAAVERKRPTVVADPPAPPAQSDATPRTGNPRE